jgi:hypothetical protein
MLSAGLQMSRLLPGSHVHLAKMQAMPGDKYKFSWRRGLFSVWDAI